MAAMAGTVGIVSMATRKGRGGGGKEPGAGNERPIPISRTLAARAAQLRMHEWGTLAPRRKQLLALFLKRLREDAGDSEQTLANAAKADGVVGMSVRSVWYVEAMTDLTVATDRERVNLMVVAYWVEHYGSSLDAAWRAMTAEEPLTAALRAVGGGANEDEAAAVREEARQLAEVYTLLRLTNPDKARQLAEYVDFIVNRA